MKKKKFTLVELLVVITIIGILAALIVPALGRAKKKSMIGSCRSNLKNIGTVVSSYYTDGDTAILPSTWLSATSPFEFEAQLLTCPVKGKTIAYEEHPDSPGATASYTGFKDSGLARDTFGVDAHLSEQINVVYQDGSVQAENE